MKPREFFTRLEHDRIVEAIRRAEKRTSGEIRLFVSRHNPEDAVVAAREHFNQLGMQKTKERNGVLIFVAPKAHKFAVFGDTGVHAKCGEPFWRALVGEMSGHFKQARFTEGIIHAIGKAGDLLAEHFPRKTDDRNELPDEIARD